MNLFDNIGSIIIKTLFPGKETNWGGPAPSHDLLPMFCIWKVDIQSSKS